MDWVLCMCVLFCIGSISGWVVELFFRRFFSSHKWINPGFLVGPYLPLYGFGVTGLFVMSYFIDFTKWFGMVSWVNTLLVILIMSIGMTIIEYIAGLIFIKGMGIKLWDYSDRWGNIQGIICPLFSFFWAVIAAFFFFVLKKPCENLLFWFAKNTETNAWFPFILGMFYGILFVDLGYSLKISAKIRAFAKEHKVVVRYENFKESIREKQIEVKEKINYVLPFKSEISIKDLLAEYLTKVKDEIGEKKNEYLNKKKK